MVSTIGDNVNVRLHEVIARNTGGSPYRWSHEAQGSAAGLNHSNVGAVEHVGGNLSFDNAWKLAWVLGLELVELLGTKE